MRLFVDNLTNVDFSYLHPQRGLLGETWLASTELEGALDHQGMVCDFGIVKKTLRNWLDDELDHRLAVPTRSPNLKYSEVGDSIELTWQYDAGELFCRSPRQAIALVDAETITPTSTSDWAKQQLKPLLPESVDRLSLDFNTEAISGDFYHYSHGLKKHDGNCQRIAHGHRSRIQIWRDGEPAHDWEQQWAKQFCDIYIGTREDITQQSTDSLSFAYTTSQGAFELTLPISSCYLIDTDSTVEFIASHIGDVLKQQFPQHQITVKAYEGMGKGALIVR
ncbi:6-carboxytetrahydropterin synthase [Maricurvus nonylphenolicus]|uniref:6-carboxytetrahydropterin synthase n=1 Tax=Maricurvus nonylphenolicus TaxID=1008307 RepID=UPI0036F214C6